MRTTSSKAVLLVLAGLALLDPATLPAQDFSALERAVNEGISQGVYPGAVVVVGRQDGVVYQKGFGRLTWDQASPVPDPATTLWDIASVSKVVGTTSAIMRLVDRGDVDLDWPVTRYLPRFTGEGKDRVTVRMLLNHTSGLRSYARFYAEAAGREEAIELLYAEPLRREPGSSAVYSDLNAMLLGLVVEAVSGESLDQFVEREVFQPLGMNRSLYRPARSQLADVAPTGRWRGHPIAGEVNDQNAVVLGGAAGHAGVFSTAVDLSLYARMWLAGGLTTRGERFVSRETLAAFLQGSPASGTRLLGWDTRDPEVDVSVFGTLVSDAAYGHTGWTGTILWIDAERDLFLVFLTNRSYAPRVSGSIGRLRRVRAAVSDAAVLAVPGACREAVRPVC